MCGIAGYFNLSLENLPKGQKSLEVMNQLIAHRGPDGQGIWQNDNNSVGFAHRRLSIIDLSTTANQPMSNAIGNTICFNGEIYNYIELKEELKDFYSFRTNSDTEVILAAYQKWGVDCVNHLRGMFAFAIWDNQQQRLFCARDRFGIKPFYYTIQDNVFYFASEPKALLPFLPTVEPDLEAFQDYVVFQLYLYGKTLFKGVHELLRSHRLIIENGNLKKECYWEIYYNLDWNHTDKYFSEKLQYLMEDSVKFHLRSDVPVGAYVSGGVDSGIVASMAARLQSDKFKAFTGKFELGELYDESEYARSLADMRNMELYEVAMTSQDFVDSIEKVIYHLDYPVAGPGSFPQYHVSKVAAQHRKVVLGGQGGDEIFGGYTRYLVAYFEQCIKGAIEDKLQGTNFVVTYESIIPNLVALKNYKPMLKEFWREGLFEDLDRRYYRLINRTSTLKDEINWSELPQGYEPFDKFQKIFNGENVGKESYFDKMTHFDFKTLLPALLQVEDRMSMAHGLESRVPFLDHNLVEFAATMPANVKFKDGTLKMSLVNSLKHELPDKIVNRKNKMGFPVPLNDWLKSDKKVKEFVHDIFNSQNAKNRALFNNASIINGLSSESQFGRKVWGLLSLELWFKTFVDNAAHYRQLLK